MILLHSAGQLHKQYWGELACIRLHPNCLAAFVNRSSPVFFILGKIAFPFEL